MDETYRELLAQIEGGQAILFLGAGTSSACRARDGRHGLTGHGLAREIIAQLIGGDGPFPFPDHHVPTLMEAAEYYQSNHAGGRTALDTFIQERLKGLQPTLGHFLIACFPWRAIVTTNYNTVVEDAWAEATNKGFAVNELVTIRTDKEILPEPGAQKYLNLFKPHGCVKSQLSPETRMVITSQDYAASDRIRKKMYKQIQNLAGSGNTIFVGYSLGDYTFRNMYYRLFLQLKEWRHRSYAVAPVDSPVVQKWRTKALSEMRTTLINSTFDSFMLRLVKERGWACDEAKNLIKHHWRSTVMVNKGHLSGLRLPDLMKLPSSPKERRKSAKATH